MKILIVCPFFPPKNEIASQRPYSWAKYWTKSGHDVTVLTVKYVPESCDLTYDLSAFTVIRVEDTVPGRKQLHTVQNNKNSNEISLTQRLIARFVKIAKKNYVKFIEPTGCLAGNNFPNFLDLWAKNAIKYVKKEKWDFVISTGGPYCVHRIGFYLKRHRLANIWCVDWRDLWTNNYMAKGFFLFRSYEKLLEKKFHSTADFITTISDVDSDILKSITNTPVHTVYNGFDYDDMKAILTEKRCQNKKTTILYAGTIYKGYRDPTPLLQAISNLDKKTIINSDQLEICFAGRNADIVDTVKDLGIENYYNFLGYLPKDEILKKQYNADILLFLEYGEESRSLTAKIFEYLVLGKEIWGVGITNACIAGKLIEDTHSGICFGTNVQLIEEYLVRYVANDTPTYENRDMNLINKFQRKIQAEKMLELVEEKCQK